MAASPHKSRLAATTWSRFGSSGEAAISAGQISRAMPGQEANRKVMVEMMMILRGETQINYAICRIIPGAETKTELPPRSAGVMHSQKHPGTGVHSPLPDK